MTKDFIKGLKKCYSFEFKPEYRSIEYSDAIEESVSFQFSSCMLLMHLDSKLLMQLTTMNNTPNMYLAVIPNGQPLSAYMHFLPIVMSSDSGFLVTYDTYEMSSLKYPFETKCVDYTEIGFTSRKECYDQCSTAFEETTDNGHIRKDRNETANNSSRVIDTNKQLLREFRRRQPSCRSKCYAEDCHVVYFKARTGKVTTDQPMLGIIAPQSPKRGTTVRPIHLIRILWNSFFSSFKLGCIFGISLRVALFSFMKIFKALTTEFWNHK